jgi:oligopeptidase A
MELRGVGLGDAEQRSFNGATAELARLGSSFGNHVLDATAAWTLKLVEPAEVEGLPDSLRELLAQAAREAGDSGASGHEGPWLMGLDQPRVAPFLRYSRRRDLRETVYRAQVARASGGDHDNRPLIEQILTLRLEQARRLGYASWAEVSLASKMAASVAEVEQLLEDLRQASYPAAERELAELKACAARHGAGGVVRPLPAIVRHSHRRQRSRHGAHLAPRRAPLPRGRRQQWRRPGRLLP